MCTRPILIKNKKFKSLSVETRNSFISVPCGVCDECLRKRAKELYVRVRFEAEETIKAGGNGFMCTLTYDDTNVPLLHHLGKTYMVFNKKDVIFFIKRLRTSLDRFFMKRFGVKAPYFKYLVTSEYGTNPVCTHRPHYHLIILFKKPVSLFIFNKCFKTSLVNQKTGKRYFGKIYQCDLLDITKGGIRYSAKYILKDQTYSNQNDIIRQKIKFYTEQICLKHGIILFPFESDHELLNKVIRSTKDYKKDINSFVGKYRNMLQFYMCSNDMGCSAIISRYGDNLFSLGSLNLDGFTYAIPKAVIRKIERSVGTKSRLKLSKSVFITFLKSALCEAVNDNIVDKDFSNKILDFANSHLQPLYGSLYFTISQDEFPYFDYLSSSFSVDDAIANNEFYFNNEFFFYRDIVCKVLSWYNSSEKLEFRAKVAFEKTSQERENYVRKKRNKGY